MGQPVILLLHRSRTFDVGGARRLLLRRCLGGDRHRVSPVPLLPTQSLLELRVLVGDHVRVLLQAQVLPQEVLRACRVRGVFFGWMYVAFFILAVQIFTEAVISARNTPLWRWPFLRGPSGR